MLVEIIMDEHFVRHYSDIGMMIKQVETGVMYSDAIDERPCKYTYEETDIPIPVPPKSEEE